MAILRAMVHLNHSLQAQNSDKTEQHLHDLIMYVVMLKILFSGTYLIWTKCVLEAKKVSCHVFLEVQISTKTNIFIVWKTEILF